MISKPQSSAILHLWVLFSVDIDVMFCPAFAGPEASPRYCRVFPGVKCDSSNRVLELDLTKLEIEGKFSSLTLQKITEVIAPLANLESLILSGLGITGSLLLCLRWHLKLFPT
jgi:hypothetical protein